MSSLAEQIKQCNQFIQLQQMAENEGVYLGVMDYHSDYPIPKDGGTYIVLTPNIKMFNDILETPQELPNLLARQKSLGYDKFNPNYWFFEIKTLDNKTSFDLFMDIGRAIQHEAIIINACREIGYDVYPRCMERYTTAEIHRLDQKRMDRSIPDPIRYKMDRTYKKFIADVYHKYIDREEDMYLRPNKQKVERDFFEKHKIPVCYDRVNEFFLNYFETHLKEYPEFYYFIEDKPSIDIMNIAKLWTGNPLRNPYKDDVEIRKWDITFAVDKQAIFYKLLLEYLTRKCHPESSLIYVGDNKDLIKITVDERDIQNWDNLCGKNGVRYYINKGDIAELNADATRNITIAVNIKDKEKVLGIMARLFNEHTAALPVKPSQVAENFEKIDRIREELLPNPEFVEEGRDLARYKAKLAGYTDIDFDTNRGH